MAYNKTVDVKVMVNNRSRGRCQDQGDTDYRELRHQILERKRQISSGLKDCTGAHSTRSFNGESGHLGNVSSFGEDDLLSLEQDGWTKVVYTRPLSNKLKNDATTDTLKTSNDSCKTNSESSWMSAFTKIKNRVFQTKSDDQSKGTTGSDMMDEEPNCRAIYHTLPEEEASNIFSDRDACEKIVLYTKFKTPVEEECSESRVVDSTNKYMVQIVFLFILILAILIYNAGFISVVTCSWFK